MRSLNRPLNRDLNRQLDNRLSRWPNRGVRPPNTLADACRELNHCLRLHKRLIRDNPHLIGPAANGHYQRALAAMASAKVCEAALNRVYGTEPSREPSASARVWAEYYPDFTSERQKRKWVKFWFGNSLIT